MALTRIVGDIHGDVDGYRRFALQMRTLGEAERSVQVGDYGMGFYNPRWNKFQSEWQANHPTHRFIRGNHDDPALCKTMPNYIADGTVEDDKMFIGGAWSIDHASRIEGKTWWADEELSINELNTMIDIYRTAKPRVMFTHDCPTSISYDMFNLHMRTQFKTRTAEALQAMWEYHQPEMWFFGHWHETKDITLNGTKFQCLGCLEYMDVDI